MGAGLYTSIVKIYHVHYNNLLRRQSPVALSIVCYSEHTIVITFYSKYIILIALIILLLELTIELVTLVVFWSGTYFLVSTMAMLFGIWCNITSSVTLVRFFF